MSTDGLAGRRILVVEDELLLAVAVEEVLEELGCVVVGPVSRLDAALGLAQIETLDAAILDISIRGGQIYPVAEALRGRHIPFIFTTGYGDWSLPPDFQNQPRLTKPFSHHVLEKQLRLLWGTGGEQSAT